MRIYRELHKIKANNWKLFVLICAIFCSIQAVFAKYLSSELVHYIEDVNSFLSDFGTTNAAYALPARDPITPGESSLEMSTVKEGMNALPRRLLTQFRNDSTKYVKNYFFDIL